MKELPVWYTSTLLYAAIMASFMFIMFSTCRTPPCASSHPTTSRWKLSLLVETYFFTSTAINQYSGLLLSALYLRSTPARLRLTSKVLGLLTVSILHQYFAFTISILRNRMSR